MNSASTFANGIMYPQIQRGRVVSVFAAQRRFEVQVKDGALVHATVYSVPPAFRMPTVGEIWSITRQSAGATWIIGDKLEEANEASPIEELEEGDMRLGSSFVRDSSGRLFVAVDIEDAIEQADGDEIRLSDFRWSSQTQSFIYEPLLFPT